MNIKDRLSTLMKKKGLTAAQLARSTGVPRQVISDWLGGTTPRNLVHLKAISEVLGVSVDTLCFGSSNEKDQSNSVMDLIGDDWITGVFEIKLRRIKR